VLRGSKGVSVLISASIVVSKDWTAPHPNANIIKS